MRQTYGELWDRYVSVSFPKLQEGKGDLQYPGAEWGSEQSWSAIFDKLFVAAEVARWDYAFEIGGGGGKYTEKVLNASDQVRVWGFDVSRNFLESTAKRLSRYVEAERLTLEEIDPLRADAIFRTFEAQGLVRKVDAMFSIDAMVHVDLQYLVTYWINAALVLKPGGVIVMTLADPTSEVGLQKLLRDIQKFYKFQGRMCPKFEFLSKSIVTHVLQSLGFKIEYLEQWSYNLSRPARDLYLIARLERPEQADRYRESINTTSASDASLEEIPSAIESYGEYWDRCWSAAQSPIDEYSNQVFATLLERVKVANWSSAVQLGGWDGRFARQVLECNDRVKLWSFDVSRRALDAARVNLHEFVSSGRLVLECIDGASPDQIVRVLERERRLRTVDAVFSIDAMAHVDLQYIVAYWINAALVLKRDGYLIMSLADATSSAGFARLIGDIKSVYRFQGQVCSKLEYISADIVGTILNRLGFHIELLEHLTCSGAETRDLFVIARLARPEQADSLIQFISAEPMTQASVAAEANLPSESVRSVHFKNVLRELPHEQREAAVLIGKALLRSQLAKSYPILNNEQLNARLKESWGDSKREYLKLGTSVLRRLESAGFAVAKIRPASPRRDDY